VVGLKLNAEDAEEKFNGRKNKKVAPRCRCTEVR